VNSMRPNRRSFLKGTAGILAAGIAAPFVTARSWAKDEAPNERLVAAAIGAGGRGSDIGHQAGRHAAMAACADVHRGNAERFASAKQYEGRCEVHEDYRRLLERKDINVVTCGTPDHWHTRIAIEAMQAGKDIYCEKPLTLTLMESRQIARVTSETGRVLQVGTQQRSENERRFLKAVAIARSGRLGKKLHALSSVGGATRGGPFATREPPAELNWDFWLGQASKVAFAPERIGWNFRWWFEYSGGQVTDWGVHHTDIALWALGGEETGAIEAEGQGQFPVERRTMLAALLGKKPFTDLPNSYNVISSFDCKLKLENGNTLELLSKQNNLIIEGERGKIVVNRGHLFGEIVQEIERDPKEREKLDEEVAKLYRGMPMRGHMANFFHCVRTREKPISDVWTHVSSVNACHLANIAMLLERKVRFDPATYEFAGDEEANALRERPQRPEYAIKV
jgi:myo-inositol 2-dehydrogenase/D-chiro-inositol 1-dehydrogenase